MITKQKAVDVLGVIRQSALNKGLKDEYEACEMAIRLIRREMFKELDCEDTKTVQRYINSDEFQDLLDRLKHDPYDSNGYMEDDLK